MFYSFLNMAASNRRRSRIATRETRIAIGLSHSGYGGKPAESTAPCYDVETDVPRANRTTIGRVYGSRWRCLGPCDTLPIRVTSISGRCHVSLRSEPVRGDRMGEGGWNLSRSAPIAIFLSAPSNPGRRTQMAASGIKRAPSRGTYRSQDVASASLCRCSPIAN